jgi:hypothetical protein
MRCFPPPTQRGRAKQAPNEDEEETREAINVLNIVQPPLVGAKTSRPQDRTSAIQSLRPYARSGAPPSTCIHAREGTGVLATEASCSIVHMRVLAWIWVPSVQGRKRMHNPYSIPGITRMCTRCAEGPRPLTGKQRARTSAWCDSLHHDIRARDSHKGPRVACVAVY